MIPQWKLQIVELPITIGSLDAYTDNDVIGGTLTSDAIEQVKGGGYVAWARLVDDAEQSEPLRVWLFNAAPSTIADDAAHAPTEADFLKWLGTIDIAAADYTTVGSGAQAAFVEGKDVTTGEFIWFDALASGTLSARLVAYGDTPDYADADDLTLHLGLMVM